MSWRWQQLVEIAEYYTGVKIVRNLATKLARQLLFSPEDEFGLELAVDEAVTNAWKAQLLADLTNGRAENADDFNQVRVDENQKTCSHPIQVFFAYNDELLQIVVTDRGTGLLPGAQCSLDLKQDHGRGCYLMQAYMDKVVWQPRKGGGTECILEKRIPRPCFGF